MHRVKEELSNLVAELSNYDNKLMVAAEETGDPEVLIAVATALVKAAHVIKKAQDDIASKPVISQYDIDAMVALANEFDQSGDELLRKQATVLDQVLLNLGVAKTGEEVSKAAQDAETDRIRESRRSKDMESDYSSAKKQHDAESMSSEAAKSIKKHIKKYRPLETPLSTRYCPDHAGSSVIRIADGVFQCPLDKKVYSWKEGFETMKGNVVPGTDVTNQTQMADQAPAQRTSFSTRETKLNDMS